MVRSVVITGAGSGIGRAIAHTLATRGWHIIATDLNEEAAAATIQELPLVDGSEHTTRQLNVTDHVQANNVAEELFQEFNVAAWVNNAGVSFMDHFLEMPIEKYDLTMDVNLKGVYVCAQAAARQMVKKQVAGVIVNTASMAGKQGRVPFLADYVASKFGVVGLTQAIAFELAKYGIRVNSVCPGYVATPMQARELEWEANLKGTTPEAVKQSWVDDTPLGRLEEPTDVAKVVAFLLSDDADFMTGESIAINGGAFMD